MHPHDPATPATGTSDIQVNVLADYIDSIGLTPAPLPAEFYYQSLPLCVIDAVFSIGVTYTSTRNTVIRFCKNQHWGIGPDHQRVTGEKSVSDLVDCFAGLSPEGAAGELFGNRQRTSSTSGILKAEAVLRFARSLLNAGINDFPDLIEERLVSAEEKVRDIPGQRSGISFDYFRMLAGDDTRIKPDRMVLRFIATALGEKPEKVGPELAKELLQAAVLELNKCGHTWSPRKLDYVIWLHQSSTGK